MLPSMINSDGIRKYTATQFGGYNHTLAAQDGEVWDMAGMTSDYYPLLSVRQKRYERDLGHTMAAGSKITGMLYNNGAIWYAAGEMLFKVTGTAVTTVGAVSSSVITAMLGNFLVIWPDKKYVDTTALSPSLAEIETTTGAVSCTIGDGTYAEETAEANTITYTGNDVTFDFTDLFTVGDAVHITGSAYEENNATLIIREMDATHLRFYENTFTLSAEHATDSATLTIKREAPDLDFIFENENRLWGCKDDVIYCCKLGDFKNWYVYDGVATDSYAAGVGSSGEFTGARSYLGYPCFFKEDIIYKVYGSQPSNYQIMSSATLGVKKGCGKSLAVAGETLFYVSKQGPVAYSGGIPTIISRVFGPGQRYDAAIGGSDGVRYFLAITEDGEQTLFYYDTRYNIWIKEEERDVPITDACTGDVVYFGAPDDTDRMFSPVQGAITTEEEHGSIFSVCEFADFVEGDPNRKGTSKIQIRIELEANANVTIYMLYDSREKWEAVSTLRTTVKKSFYLPIIPKRSDHFKIAIQGTGRWTLYSLVRENYSGSEVH